MITPEEVLDVAQKMEDICKFINSSITEESVLKTTIKKCEERQQDILHEFEFSMLSRRKRDLLAKELKDIRLERRNAKILIELLEPLAQQVKTKSTIMSSITNISNKIKDIKNDQDNRTYNQRNQNTDIKLTPKDHFEIKKENNKFKVGRKSAKKSV